MRRYIFLFIMVKRIFITLFFVIQLISIAYQLNAETNYFNWSMYHTWIAYDAHVIINGKELNETEFFERYKFKKSGFEGRAIGHLKRRIIKREDYYNDNNKVEVEVTYTENSHKNTWYWKN